MMQSNHVEDCGVTKVLGQSLGQSLEQGLDQTGTGQFRKGWYALMQSAIQTSTPSTNPTNPTKRENVGFVENVERVRAQNETGPAVEAVSEAEASPEAEVVPEAEASPAAEAGSVAKSELYALAYRDVPLMVRHNGKPESCVHCGRWCQQEGEPWWVGSCDITGAKKTNKSHCDIMCREAVAV